jgi:hypothetical protein
VTRIVFLPVPQLHLLDLAGPAQVFFTAANLGYGYELHYVAEQSDAPTAQGGAVRASVRWPELAPADLIIVPLWRAATLAGTGQDLIDSRFAEALPLADLAAAAGVPAHPDPALRAGDRYDPAAIPAGPAGRACRAPDRARRHGPGCRQGGGLPGPPDAAAAASPSLTGTCPWTGPRRTAIMDQ